MVLWSRPVVVSSRSQRRKLTRDLKCRDQGGGSGPASAGHCGRPGCGCCSGSARPLSGSEFVRPAVGPSFLFKKEGRKGKSRKSLCRFLLAIIPEVWAPEPRRDEPRAELQRKQQCPSGRCRLCSHRPFPPPPSPPCRRRREALCSRQHCSAPHHHGAAGRRQVGLVSLGHL